MGKFFFELKQLERCARAGCMIFVVFFLLNRGSNVPTRICMKNVEMVRYCFYPSSKQHVERNYISAIEGTEKRVLVFPFLVRIWWKFTFLTFYFTHQLFAIIDIAKYSLQVTFCRKFAETVEHYTYSNLLKCNLQYTGQRQREERTRLDIRIEQCLLVGCFAFVTGGKTLVKELITQKIFSSRVRVVYEEKIRVLQFSLQFV